MESFGQDPDGSSTQNLQFARAGRASRAGTRAGRLVRFIRLIRLLRVVKLYKYCGKQELDENGNPIPPPEEVEKSESEDEEEEVHSEIGKSYAEYITRIVIIGVLFLLFVLPLLDSDTSDTSALFATQQLDAYSSGLIPVTQQEFNATVEHFKSVWGNQLLYLVLNRNQTLQFDGFIEVNQVDEIDHLRKVEMKRYESPTTSVWIRSKQSSVDGSLYSIGTTLFVTLLLAVGSWLFSRDAHEAVIMPIEKMISFVAKLSKDPLGQHDSDEKDDEGIMKLRETQILQSTFQKLAGLLKIGFGVAGSQIIAQNMVRKN